MTTRSPFSLRIFVADGDPDGLRIVERSNWIGRAIVFPRALLPSIKQRSEFGHTGVYLLIGPREDGEGDMLYVGEGDPIKARLESHYANKDFWTRAVCFVASQGQLNKAHVQYLEAALVRLAKGAKRVPLDNANQPTDPTLSEADLADMDVFLGNMLGMLPVLGISAFEKAKAESQVSVARQMTLKGKGIVASGVDGTNGFVVTAGSQAVLETVPSMAEHVRGMYDLRLDLIKNGVMIPEGDHYMFAQDYAFSSPSTAAAVVLGRSANGRVEWKDAAGRTLKWLQEQEAGS